MAWFFLIIAIIYLTAVEGFRRSFNRQNKYTVSKSTTHLILSLAYWRRKKTDYVLELIRNLAPLALPVEAFTHFSANVDRQILSCLSVYSLNCLISSLDHTISKHDTRQFKEYTDKQLINAEEDRKQFKELAEKQIAAKKELAKALLQVQVQDMKRYQTSNDLVVALEKEITLKNNAMAKPADNMVGE